MRLNYIRQTIYEYLFQNLSNFSRAIQETKITNILPLKKNQEPNPTY
jgi:hypothetical protein